MTGYTFGSVEGLRALQEALAAHPGPHEQTCGPQTACDMAFALETAAFAGHPWAEEFTGYPVERSVCWWGAFQKMRLTGHQVLGLVEAMVAAWELGDSFAGEWLGDMAEAYGVDWV